MNLHVRDTSTHLEVVQTQKPKADYKFIPQEITCLSRDSLMK